MLYQNIKNRTLLYHFIKEPNYITKYYEGLTEIGLNKLGNSQTIAQREDRLRNYNYQQDITYFSCLRKEKVKRGPILTIENLTILLLKIVIHYHLSRRSRIDQQRRPYLLNSILRTPITRLGLRQEKNRRLRSKHDTGPFSRRLYLSD